MKWKRSKKGSGDPKRDSKSKEPKDATGSGRKGVTEVTSETSSERVAEGGSLQAPSTPTSSRDDQSDLEDEIDIQEDEEPDESPGPRDPSGGEPLTGPSGEGERPFGALYPPRGLHVAPVDVKALQQGCSSGPDEDRLQGGPGITRLHVPVISSAVSQVASSGYHLQQLLTKIPPEEQLYRPYVS